VAFMTSPVITVEIDFPGNGTWSDVTGYVGGRSAIKVTRGRQDQHSTVQGGTASLTLDNPDGRFSANNVSSPYYPNVKLQRPIRIRAAWVPGKNYIANPTVDTDLNFWLWNNANRNPFSGALARLSATHVQQGTNAMELRNGSASARDLSVQTDFGSLVVGQQYTASLWVYQTAGSTKIGIVGIGFSTATTTTGAFTQVTYTFTATQRYHTLVVTAVNLAATSSIWVDTIQVEDGAAATTFDGAHLATWWGRFAGYTGSAWPVTWSGDAGLWSEVQLSCVDMFARLGRYKCRSTLAEQTKYSLAPPAYWPLGDASGSDSALQIGSDPTIGPMVIDQIGVNPTGQVQFGSGTGPAYGDGSVLQFVNNHGDASNHYFLASYNAPTPIDGSNGFCVVFDYATTQLPTFSGQTVLVAAYGVSGDWIRVRLTSAGAIVGERLSAGGSVVYQLTFGPFSDLYNGKVTQVGLIEAWNGTSFDVILSLGSSTVTATAATTKPFKAKSFFVGGHQGGVDARDGYTGSISNVCFSTVAIFDVTSNNPVQYVSQAGAGGIVRGASSQNIGALLDFLDPNIPRLIGQSGFGPSGIQLSGQSLLSAIQSLSAVEQTAIFVDPMGFVIQYARNQGYYNNTGVGVREYAAGQYSAPVPVLDDQELVNDATITRPNGAGGYAHNETSKAAYGVYDTSQQIPTFLAQGAIDIANSLVNRFAEPSVRVPSVTIDVLTQWAAIGVQTLTADVAYNLYLKDLPATSPLVNADLLVEGYSEQISIDSWLITFNCTLASVWRTWQLDVSPYSQLDSINRIAW
jgi:hypothetical protein